MLVCLNAPDWLHRGVDVFCPPGVEVAGGERKAGELGWEEGGRWTEKPVCGLEEVCFSAIHITTVANNVMTLATAKKRMFRCWEISYIVSSDVLLESLLTGQVTGSIESMILV